MLAAFLAMPAACGGGDARPGALTSDAGPADVRARDGARDALLPDAARPEAPKADAPAAEAAPPDGPEPGAPPDGPFSSVGRAHCFAVAPAGAREPALQGPVFLQNVASGQGVDLSGGDASDGRAITEWRHTGGKPQQWWFDRAGDGWNIKSNVDGAWCLTRRDAEAGAPVLLRRCSAEGHWEFVSLGDGRYHLKVPGSDLYLNVRDEKHQDGRELVVTPSRAAGAEWLLIDVGFRARGTSDCTDPTLDEVSFLTTHNAFHSSGYGGKVLPNQTRDIARQLADGVRGFQLDVYDHDGGVWTCHGRCDLDGLRGPPLRQLLATMVSFLEANPREIASVFLEDYVQDPDDLCAALRGVEGLEPLLFRPQAYDVLETGWPRLSRLRADGRRLLVFSQRDGREACGVMYDRRYTSENYWSLGSLTSAPDDSCRTRWAGLPLNSCGRGGRFRPLHVMNNYRDAMLTPNCAGDNGPRLERRALEICAQAAGRKPNYVAVDCYEIGQAKQLVDELNRCDPQACRCP